MPGSASEAWSTLGYGALSYYWGIPVVDLDRLSDAEKKLLVELTNHMHEEAAEHDVAAFVARVKATPPGERRRMLLEAAIGLQRSSS